MFDDNVVPGEDGDWDDYTVGSLAAVTPSFGGGGGPNAKSSPHDDPEKGWKNKNKQRRRGSVLGGGHGADDDQCNPNSGGGDGHHQEDEDKTSPARIARRRGKAIRATKIAFLVLLVAGGAFLAAASYLLLAPKEASATTVASASSPNDEEKDTAGEGPSPSSSTAAAALAVEGSKASAGAAAGVVAGVFVLLLAVFLRYDYLAEQRTSLVVDMAVRSRHIVDQLFPSVVRDRLLRAGVGDNGDINNNSDRHSDLGNGSDHGNDGSDRARSKHQPAVTDFKKLTAMNTLANQRASETPPALANAAGSAPGKQSQIKSFLATGVHHHQHHHHYHPALANAAKSGEHSPVTDEPIAEQFLNTTVLFADIAGFTAWSSERDPPQVFKLLETVYGAFDEMAALLQVFKVETIGDSYMAVTGLPEPDEMHAVSMSRFAYQCLVKMHETCSELESQLGPGTNELAMRIGLHSGPVTAGVLRGQKSRFQLFGDTVNTASRMESTGMKGRIQVSESTANELVKAGKEHWIKEREDRVVAKGKGEMRTFWLEPRKKRTTSQTGTSDTGTDNHHSRFNLSLSDGEEPDSPEKKRGGKLSQFGLAITLSNMEARLSFPAFTKRIKSKYEKLINWNTDVILKYLAQIDACRRSNSMNGRGNSKAVDYDNEPQELPPAYESVTDVITFPEFQPLHFHSALASSLSSLRDDVHSLVSEIACLYNDALSFHNFEHASHVTLAANKLVTRMCTSEDFTDTELYSLTYGISSDPIAQFAVVFASLVHDLGHSGVTNSTLVMEEADVATKYKGRSVAEQNSVSVAWSLLMQPRFKRIRECIYAQQSERKRFRQVLVNAVMATDISDRAALQDLQRKWTLAFADFEDPDDVSSRGGGRPKAMSSALRDAMNRKATVVIEHLIQVANVAHTMQHWTVYRKWNQRLFEEMYTAFMNGRASFDPASIWYKSELAFMQFYVLALAKKMNESGVFGNCGEQYVSYALANRNQWEQQGHDELKGMIEAVRVMEPDGSELLSQQEEQATLQKHQSFASDSGDSDIDSCHTVPEVRVGPAASLPVSPSASGKKAAGRNIPCRGSGFARIPSNELSIDAMMPGDPKRVAATSPRKGKKKPTANFNSDAAIQNGATAEAAAEGGRVGCDRHIPVHVPGAAATVKGSSLVTQDAEETSSRNSDRVSL